MRVLILGANGQLGSDLVRAAGDYAARFEIVPLYRKDLDVSQLDSIPAVLSQYAFDVLVNCTGYHKTDEVDQHASEAFLINAQATRRLAQACRARRARLVHISTDYVFDGKASRPYAETDPPSPLNVYGASKLVGENLALAEYASGTVIMRVASLFGIVGASGKGGNFVETILRVAREKGVVRVVNDITMSPTATADIARIILSMIEKAVPAGIYHAVNSGQATWFEFALQIVHQAGIAAQVIPISSAEYPTVAVRPAYSVLDNRKVASQVGDIPSWQEALERYLKCKGYIP